MLVAGVEHLYLMPHELLVLIWNFHKLLVLSNRGGVLPR